MLKNLNKAVSYIVIPFFLQGGNSEFGMWAGGRHTEPSPFLLKIVPILRAPSALGQSMKCQRLTCFDFPLFMFCGCKKSHGMNQKLNSAEQNWARVYLCIFLTLGTESFLMLRSHKFPIRRFIQIKKLAMDWNTLTYLIQGEALIKGEGGQILLTQGGEGGK